MSRKKKKANAERDEKKGRVVKCLPFSLLAAAAVDIKYVCTC
jgi:hypothetical protein